MQPLGQKSLLYSKIHTQRRVCVAGVIVTLIFSVLACQIDVGGADPPGQPIPTQSEAASDLIETWKSAITSAAITGQVLVLLDEVQMTSFLAYRLEASENPVLHEPQVYLRQNSIQIYGISDHGLFRARVLLAVTPHVDPEGTISFELTTAEFGPIPAPGALKDTLSVILTEAFTGTIGTLATGIKVTSLTIDDGQMAIVGELR